MIYWIDFNKKSNYEEYSYNQWNIFIGSKSSTTIEYAFII